jgi:hypothetical protein
MTGSSLGENHFSLAYIQDHSYTATIRKGPNPERFTSKMLVMHIAFNFWLALHK